MNLKLGEFVTFLRQDEEGRKRLGDSVHAMRFSDPEFEDGYFFLSLKRIESAVVPGSGRCFFLQEWRRSERVTERGEHPGSAIVGRCGIYGSRPLMCRSFPAALDSGGLLGLLHERVAAAPAHALYTLCPEPWVPARFGGGAGMDPLHTLVTNQYELAFHNRIVDEWNAQPGLMKDFIPFAVGAYNHRLRLAMAPAKNMQLSEKEDPRPIVE